MYPKRRTKVSVVHSKEKSQNLTCNQVDAHLPTYTCRLLQNTRNVEENSEKQKIQGIDKNRTTIKMLLKV
jgi:hypothetical protein